MSHRVLVVDDQAEQRGLAKIVLDHAGFEVETAADPEQALDLAQEQVFDAVLIDFYLPLRNGIELAIALRRLSAYRTVPVIIQSSEHDPTLRALSRQAGVSCWLRKPVSAEELVATLRRLLEP